MKKLTIGLAGFLLVLAIATDAEVMMALLFGWAAFLSRVVQRMAPDWGSLAVGGMALVLFAAGTHWLGRAWNRRTTQGPEAPQRRWKIRWSLSIVALVLLLFAAGTSLVCVTHQVGWLVTSNEPLHGPSLKSSEWSSSYRLKLIGIAMSNHESQFGSLPRGGTFAEDGSMLHSWETYLLPYLNYDIHEIDFQHAWNHPRNEKYFRSVLAVFINPDFQPPELEDAQGFGLSHYAANRRVLAGNKGMRMQDITHGTSETLLIGEVNAQFQPWGHPVNWRDPVKGINKSPQGFGGAPNSGGARFAMADGSVRFVSERVSPEVLRALSNPTGGEAGDGADGDGR